jgi:transketolase
MIYNDRHMKKSELDIKSKKIRSTVIDMLMSGRRGHLASAFSMVEIVRVLYDDILKYKSNNPAWENRDRFILSKGHGCLSYYAVLAEKGFFPKSLLSTFCQTKSILGGHPGINIPGVEVSTGSLGHGLPIGIGMAIAAKARKKNHRVFVLVGDGECDEGSVWEGALCAGKHQLDNLTVIIDYNKMQSYGLTAEVQNLEPFVGKWKAFGFGVKEVDGHNINKLKLILKHLPFYKGRPSLLIAHTIKGKGIACAEQNAEWHHKRGITDDEITEMRKALREY